MEEGRRALSIGRNEHPRLIRRLYREGREKSPDVFGVSCDLKYKSESHGNEEARCK